MAYSISDEGLAFAIRKAATGEELVRIEHPSRSTYFKELSAFAKSQRAKREPSVTDMTLRNWLGTRKPHSPKAHSKRFLLAYVIHLLPDDDEGTVHDRQTLEDIRRHLKASLPPMGGAKPVDAAVPLDPVFADRMGHIFAVSERTRRNVALDLFRGGVATADQDASYYVLYRYSTNSGLVLKSFLVIHKPDPKIFSHFGFDHFIWGGNEDRKAGARRGIDRNNIFRECEGAILKLEKAYYLLGYNFIVPADKRGNQEDYDAKRDEARREPNGLGMTAIEYDDIRANPGLFGGITMTLAAQHQPIAARIAFLHLGTQSRTKTTILDHDVHPKELRPDDIAEDLEKMVVRLKEDTRFETLAPVLQKQISAANWKRSGANKLATDILQLIDNTPAWGKRRKREKVGHGALETFGRDRPRD